MVKAVFYVKQETGTRGLATIVGDYVVGDAESPVAVVALGSHMEETPVRAGAAISGPLHTENLGIEKVVGNVIANPNLRFLLLCGAEVMGHITGQTMKALHSNGVDNETGRIINATGAIPYIENMPEEAIERFREQVEMVDMVDVEDLDSITSKIRGCVVHDAGAIEEEPLVFKYQNQGIRGNLKKGIRK